MSNNLIKFRDRVNEIISDLSHHNIPNTIRFFVGEEEYILDDSEYPSGIEMDSLFWGCGCVVGASVHLKEEEEDK